MCPVEIKATRAQTARSVELDLRLAEASVPRSMAGRDAVGRSVSDLIDLRLTQLDAFRAYVFGDTRDGVIETAAFTREKGAVELGYYYGDTKPKSIIKISSQIGCPVSCRFCEVGEERFKRNLSPGELYEQVALMAQIAAARGLRVDAGPHKVSVAGTGESLLNPHLCDGLELLAPHDLSFKISTVLPSSKICFDGFERLARFAGSYRNPVQLQISLISTSEEYRRRVSGIRLADFTEIRRLAERWHSFAPVRRQINLSLILSSDNPVSVESVRGLLPPELFRFRFRNYVPTQNGACHGLSLIPAGQMQAIKDSFRTAGYDVTDDATPTPTEMEFSLASNVTRRRMMVSLGIPIELKRKQSGDGLTLA